MFDKDHEDVEDNLPAPSGKIRDAHGGHTLPLFLLEDAFGRDRLRVSSAPRICVLVRTKHNAWIKTLIRAAKLMGDWSFVYDGTANLRQREEQERDAISALSRGCRVLCVGSHAEGSIPSRLSHAADYVVDIDTVTMKSASRAIRSLTQGRPRGLRQADLAGLDLFDAMVAIRPNSTAMSCVRRLSAGMAKGNVDPSVASAPPMSELAGYGEAREWADRLIEDLELWRKGEIPFAAIQRNAVLAGPPGVGKSSFVRSLAKSTGLPLFASSVGQMFATSAGYLDSIVKAIDELFSKARAAGQTAIVFLDEIEGFPSRDSLQGRDASWWTPVINHMLTTLDSAMSSASSQLIVIGATNHPQRLDPALIRPGRLDRVIWIAAPDAEALSQIYRQHLGAELPDADLSGIGELAAGSTGADVVGHIKAARANARAAGETLALGHLIDAVCPPSHLTPEALHRAAIHEAGHAVAAIVLGGWTVRNMMLGGAGSGSEGMVTFQRPAHSLGSLEEKRIEVIQLLAGRAAEDFFTGAVSSGSGGSDRSDLARATNILAASHISFGLGDTLVYLAEPEDALAILRRSPQLLEMVEAELQQHYRTALDLMRENELAVRAVAEALVQHRTLTGAVVREIVSQKRTVVLEGHRA